MLIKKFYSILCGGLTVIRPKVCSEGNGVKNLNGSEAIPDAAWHTPYKMEEYLLRYSLSQGVEEIVRLRLKERTIGASFYFFS